MAEHQTAEAAPGPEEKRREGDAGAPPSEGAAAAAGASNDAEGSGTHQEAAPAEEGGEPTSHAEGELHGEGEEGEVVPQPPEDPEITRQKLEAADACKAEGNRLYGEGKWEEAAAKYVEAIDAGAPELLEERALILSERVTPPLSSSPGLTRWLLALVLPSCPQPPRATRQWRCTLPTWQPAI